MKILKKSYKFILGLVIGIIVSSLTAYATTSYIISSDKVEYKDNSELGVDNVQAAIDGTCTNIDKRLDDISTQNILWSGVAQMGGSETITLNQKVSSQTNGIVLVFSFNESTGAQNWGWHTFFIPKTFTSTHAGNGHSFFLYWNSISTKYIYITDTSLVGAGANTEPVQNQRFVLRYVIGV